MTTTTETVRHFVSLIKVFTALLAALDEAATVSNAADYLCDLIGQMVYSTSEVLRKHASYDVVSAMAGAVPTIIKVKTGPDICRFTETPISPPNKKLTVFDPDLLGKTLISDYPSKSGSDCIITAVYLSCR